ncbi:olfactory receptor 6N1-like [Rhinophrynus dorsalis]
MENVFNISTSFVLLGLVELEGFRYLYCILSLATYLFIMILSFMIVFVILTEESLHEPMYILICNLVLNGIFGSTSFFPKLIFDLLTSSKQISRTGCLIQIFFVISYSIFELFSFAIMAYDTYLAVCHPLRYVTLMTNEKVVKLITGSLIFSFISVLIAVLLSARLPFCGLQIKNVFCDTMSLVILSCVNTSVNNLYGGIATIAVLVFTILIIVYSYMRIIFVCLKVFKGAYEKAIHTLVTHFLNFSIFLVGGLFIFVRHRLESANLHIATHTFLSITILTFPPFFSPVIYGLRTKALKIKVIQHLQKIKIVQIPRVFHVTNNIWNK